MPAGNGTGPLGMGPKTGRAAGYCAGYGAPGYANPMPGTNSWRSGFGFQGRGRGHRNWYHITGLPGWIRFGGQMPTSEQELEFLKRQAEFFQTTLEHINKRIEDLKKSAENKTD